MNSTLRHANASNRLHTSQNDIEHNGNLITSSALNALGRKFTLGVINAFLISQCNFCVLRYLIMLRVTLA